MAFVSHRLRVVYVANQKAAARTILNLLSSFGEVEPVRLPFLTTSPQQSAQRVEERSPRRFTVTFRKHGTLGLRFWKGSEKLRVEWLTDDGLASSEPAIRPGCVVVAVQGTSLQGIGYQDALARVKDASRPLQLTFEEPAAAMETSDAMPEARHLPPYLIFTFVRDPLLAFLSGAAEAVHRHRHGFRTGCPRPKAACLSVPCRGDVLTPLVEDVRARRCIGTQAFHVWPQVLKLAVRLPRPFGFVGRVEWLAREP